ncbi:Cytidine deaminase [Penicillium hispanicum]|uniref:Cytidine deaminase n=1 Tax=Penicillium hispanicum TaxID=1080232 RepID=UPI002541289F|nr:Cytidine deaminase [Penicillium hispanicum]KAJ5585353.1 Cytidine deaminase [Penicillium hispanicum]
MLIGLCGGICAGKHAIAEYLIQHQGFQLLELASKPVYHLADEPDDDLRLQASEVKKNGEPQSEFVFDSADLLLDFVTKRWQERWVTTDIADGGTLDKFTLRPFFLLVSVDAPVSLRWKRFSDRCWRRQLDPPDLEKFVLWNDRNLYEKDIGRVYLTDRAQVRLFNSSSSLDEFHEALQKLDLADEQRLRPNWDQYFMQLASLAAQRSNSQAIMELPGISQIVTRVDVLVVIVETVVVLGSPPVFAFMPRKMRCWRLAESVSEKEQFSIAILGISEVVYSQGYNMDSESAAILEAAGVRLRQFSPVKSRLTLWLDSVVLTPTSAVEWTHIFAISQQDKQRFE